MRQDPAAFTELKRDEDFRNWNNNTILQAAAQGVEDVLDSTFTPDPMDADAVELFGEQQKYMMSVFSSKLMTTKGKELVRQYTLPATLKRFTRNSPTIVINLLKLKLSVLKLLTFSLMRALRTGLVLLLILLLIFVHRSSPITRSHHPLIPMNSNVLFLNRLSKTFPH